MNLSKWSISTSGGLYRNGLSTRPSTATIVFLDDHSLIRETVVDFCLKPFFSNIDIIQFSDGDDALEFLKNKISHYKKIDLLITDINHPGLKGHDLVKAVRKLEWMSEIPYRIPIIILSMVEESRLPELKAEGINAYLCKSSEPEEIIEQVENILYAT